MIRLLVVHGTIVLACTAGFHRASFDSTSTFMVSVALPVLVQVLPFYCLWFSNQKDSYLA